MQCAGNVTPVIDVIAIRCVSLSDRAVATLLFVDMVLLVSFSDRE